MSTRPVAAMNEVVARQIVRDSRSDPVAIAVALADEVLDRGRWAANTCKPLIRAYEIARNQQVRGRDGHI